MKKNIFIIHGSFGSPFENWFPFTYNELTKKDYGCFVLSLPTPENQTYENWSKILTSYIDTNLLNNNSSIIAHSSACIFTIKFLVNKKINIDKLITVSGFNNFFSGDKDFDKINSEFFIDDLNLDKIVNFTKDRFSFYSENDPYLNFELLKDFQEKIKSNKVIIPDAGHFNTKSGYDKFPELIKLF